MVTVYYSAPVGQRSIAISLFVCLSVVCLYVREHISRTAGPIFTKFCTQIPLAVARSSSGGVAIRYVLLVFMDSSRFAVLG